MGRRFDDIPEGTTDTMEVGWKHFKVAELQETHSDDGLLTYILRVEAVGPPDDEGTITTYRFFFGTQEDPECEERKTRRRWFPRLLQQVSEACGVNFKQDMDIVIEDLREQEFMGFNGHRDSNGVSYNSLKKAVPVGDPAATEAEIVRPGRPAAARGRRANGPDEAATRRTAAGSASPRTIQRPVPRGGIQATDYDD